MKLVSPLHNALNAWMGQTDWSHKAHLTVALLMVAALIHTGTVSLTKWALWLPNRGAKQRAQSQQRRLSRWLHNARINVHRLYKPLITKALADWTESVMYVALDTSLFWENYCLVRLSVVHRGRTLPVSWCVLHHPSASVTFEAYEWIITRAARCLPKGVKVVLLADRGFVQTDLMHRVRARFGWHYRIRLKRDTWIWRGRKGWCQLKDYALNRGEALCFHHVRLHKGAQYGPVHVIIGRNNLNGEFWAIVSDEETTLKTFEEFSLRFDIEEGFLDDQSSGWNMQRSEIRDGRALSRLWFILALATLYVSAQGVDVVDSGNRQKVDTHWFRGNSYFRIGWDWIKTSFLKEWTLIQTVRFTSNQDSEPAMASRKQHEEQLYQIEFQVQTFVYNAT